MSKVELDRLRDIVIFLMESFHNGSPGEIKIAGSEYESLIDKYAADYPDYLIPKQLETARYDSEYFLRLIDLARSWGEKGR